MQFIACFVVNIEIYSSTMKKLQSYFLIFTFLFVFSAVSAQDETVLTIHGKAVSKGEFERIYKKNNLSGQESNQKSIEEYLQLFINFKLKVAEAESLGMDTAQSFQKELAGYRKQLAKPYLISKDVDEQLIHEAYNRMQLDVHAAHILISIENEGSPADTLKAWNEAIRLRNKILAGESFEKIASNYSTDQSAKKNQGDLGYFTGFQMVYPFESAAFNTPSGEISMPVRTRFGYHLIKVIDKRPAIGTVKVAHIMFSANESNTPEEQEKALAKINNIYSQLQAGGDFKSLAEKFSDDKTSAVKGGELQEFGTGRMVPEFEKAAFALQQVNDYSKPVKTAFGYHIIKLLEKKGIGSFDEIKSELKSKIQRDERANKSKEVFIAQLRKEYPIVENRKNLDLFIKQLPDSMLNGKWNGQSEKAAIVLFTADKRNFTSHDFGAYLAKTTTPKTKVSSKQDYLLSEYVKWQDQSLLEIEDHNLEQKYPDFRYLMNEYHDGILLFDLSDQLIWSKAVKDTAGLSEFYAQSDKRYFWEERAECTFYTFALKNDSSMITAEKQLIYNQKALYKIHKLAVKRSKKPISNELFLEKASKILAKTKSSYTLTLEDKLLEKESNHLLKQTTWAPGTSEIFDNAGEQVFIQIKAIQPKTEKALSEVKGLVTADYQNYLEEKWIAELKQKYEVHVDMKVLQSIR